MAPRAYWKGYLKLSLVSCPVKLYAATTSTNRISFNLLHKDTHNRVSMRYHDPELGEVDRSDLVKGYQFEKDRYVILEPEELDELQIESSKTISIEGFVDAGDIDVLYFDSPYFLAPDGPIAEETYAVIREALERSGKVAIARIVLSSRERIIAITPRENGFVMTTLRTRDEVRDPSHYLEPLDVDIDEEMLEMAEHIIAKKTMAFDPDMFEDRYEKAVMELIKAKISGREPVISKAPEQGKVINLMDALRASLEAERRPAAPSQPKAAAAERKKAASGKAKASGGKSKASASGKADAQTQKETKADAGAGKKADPDSGAKFGAKRLASGKSAGGEAAAATKTKTKTAAKSRSSAKSDEAKTAEAAPKRRAPARKKAVGE